MNNMHRLIMHQIDCATVYKISCALVQKLNNDDEATQNASRFILRKLIQQGKIFILWHIICRLIAKQIILQLSKRLLLTHSEMPRNGMCYNWLT